MNGSKLLVTGASGFIGSALTERLIKDGNDVRAFVRNRQKLSGLNGSISDVVEGDITDPVTVCAVSAAGRRSCSDGLPEGHRRLEADAQKRDSSTAFALQTLSGMGTSTKC